MIIFLYGPDTYRLRKKLNEIVEHYKKIHQSGLNFKIFDLEEESFQDFQNEIKSVSMFAEKKLIVLEEALGNKNFKEEFLKNSKKFIGSKNIILFYEEGEVSKDKFVNFLKRQEESQEFQLLDGGKLKNWIKKELENYKAKIEEGALDKLVEFVGNDLWQMSNEIKKLVSYKPESRTREGGVPEISSRDIEILIKPKIEPEIFKTIDAIALKNKKQALGLVHKHLEKGDSPLYLLTMINFQFRNLLIMKSSESRRELYTNDMQTLSKKLKIHPYVIRKAIQQSRKFSLGELKKIYQKIFETDLGIKTGKIDPETALDLLITEI